MDVAGEKWVPCTKAQRLESVGSESRLLGTGASEAGHERTTDIIDTETPNWNQMPTGKCIS